MRVLVLENEVWRILTKFECIPAVLSFVNINLLNSCTDQNIVNPKNSELLCHVEFAVGDLSDD